MAFASTSDNSHLDPDLFDTHVITIRLYHFLSLPTSRLDVPDSFSWMWQTWILVLADERIWIVFLVQVGQLDIMVSHNTTLQLDTTKGLTV